jgi:hypothetical protein
MGLPPRSLVFRWLAIVLLIAGWWWLGRAHPTWVAPFTDRLRNRPTPYDNHAALAGAVMLSIFIAACLWGRFSPWRSRGPDSAMGQGCVEFAAIGLAGVGVVLAIAWYFHIPLIIWMIASVTVLLGVQLGIALIYEGIKALRKGRVNRG